MSLEEEREAFVKAHLAWAAGDFERFMSFMHEDIVYTVNVDGYLVPYASSAVGKSEVRERLQLLIDTFVVARFHIETLVHEPTFSRTRVHGRYEHRTTGEILDIRVRFHGWVENGAIIRLEEYHDAAYIHAFERFVMHIQATAEAALRKST